VEPAYPALGLALRATLPEAAARELRQALGSRLAALSAQPRQSWQAYRLLAGSPEATASLLAAVPGAPADVPADRILPAFTAELARARRGPARPGEELELLWAFLPLAHRLGELRAHRGELERARQLAGADSEKLLALAALEAALEEQTGALGRAAGSLRRALEAAVHRTTDTDRKVALSIRLGRVLLREGQRAEARQLFEGILPVVERAKKPGLAASCHFYLGNVALAEQRLEDARRHHETALDIRRAKSPRAAGPSFTALGAVALAQGNYPAALAYYEQAREALEGVASDADLSYALLGLGRALSRLGDFAAAAGVLRRALGLRAEKSDSTGEGIARLALADCYLRLEQPAVALREARQAHFQLSLGRESRYLGHAEALLGRILLRQRQPAAAREHFGAALRLHRAHQDPASAAFDLAWALEAAVQRADREAVLQLGQELDAAIADQAYPEQGELLDLHLFQALDWLRAHDPEAGNPMVYLRRGYENLMRKTGFLSPDLRNRFLFQVPENRELLAAASRCGLALEAPA
ncbi:MAG TPA: tetratricopeptide repeat protein, partial [Thermoanaerobaculia bacterium]|nr:tetratricopeptide repeat protein [Thermoanaerobaculia bacterium]